MEQHQSGNVSTTNWESVELTKLIRKLRWIGLKDEASRFLHEKQDANVKRKGILSDIPYGTD